MLELDEQQQSSRTWFESLRDRICAEFETIEREAGSDASFSYTPWDRTDASGEPGGGADLNPAIPIPEDTEDFHARLRAACAAHDPTFYPRFSKWAEDYFWLPHRNVARGVGGIFYDYLEDHFDAHFAFTKDVGEAFLDIFHQLVRKRMNTPFTEEDMERLLEFRGRYVEFNLLYDRGTLFGLKTGGNTDAILMSLPPVAKWA